MAYYIISFEPEPMERFQKKHDFLDDATWIKEKKDLSEIISSPSGDSYFFVHLTNKREAMDELVLIIRDVLHTAKIIYVTEDGKAIDLKTHQMTPVGGDAYVPMQIEASNLCSIVEGLMPPEINPRGNRLETQQAARNSMSTNIDLDDLNKNPKSLELELIFSEIFGSKKKKPTWQKATNLVPESTPDELEVGDDMSDKDQELSLDDLGELEITSDGVGETTEQEEEGLDLDLDSEIDLDLSEPDELSEDTPAKESFMEIDLDTSFSLDDGDSDSLSASPPDDVGLSLDEDDSLPASDDLGFSLDDDGTEPPTLGSDLSLDDEMPSLDFGTDDPLDDSNELSLSDDLSLDEDIDLSDDAKEKLKEIDAIMDFDASQIGIQVSLSSDDESEDIGLSLVGDDDAIDMGAETSDSDIDTSLVADDLDLGSISFSSEDEEVVEAKTIAPVVEEKNKKKPKEAKETKESYDGAMGRDLKEISGAYTGEMERMQATISNLRSDREELLAKIQKLEEDKTLQNRQTLTMRAELDEKKIELSIVRKKLNDEVSELKDRLKLFEEKKLILEEKNRIMSLELDKTAHKNKIDVKKVQMRERELEQKLELLKADSESQIRHRDLKILELKRKLDAMEFDIESISVQEKRSVESRFELEDKLDKALKTLRNAITVLEDESERSGTLEALKKNIDM
jgi:hypothetical protein